MLHQSMTPCCFHSGDHCCVQAKVDTVPQFYFPGGKPVPAEVRQAALHKIDDLFRSNPDGLAVPAVRELVKEVCPSDGTRVAF